MISFLLSHFNTTFPFRIIFNMQIINKIYWVVYRATLTWRFTTVQKENVHLNVTLVRMRRWWKTRWRVCKQPLRHLNSQLSETHGATALPVRNCCFNDTRPSCAHMYRQIFTVSGLLSAGDGVWPEDKGRRCLRVAVSSLTVQPLAGADPRLVQLNVTPGCKQEHLMFTVRFTPWCRS